MRITSERNEFAETLHRKLGIAEANAASLNLVSVAQGS
jgi:hypothetical protein